MRPRDMGTLLDECAERGNGTTVHLDRPFDIAPDGGVDYDIRRLAALVRDAAGWLAAAGARTGDRVAILKPNHWDYDLLACAAVRIGALPALIAGHLPTETVLTLLGRLRPALLVTTAALLRAHPGVTGLAGATLGLDGGGPGVLPLDAVRGHAPPAPHRRQDTEPLVVNHTSGTTGVPKLVVHSTETIINRLARFESVRWPVLGVRPDDTVASASSFAHGRTFCWTASVLCLAPRKIVISTSFEPPDGLAVLRAHPPTTLEALPAAFVRWQRAAAEPDNPFRDVRLYVSTYDAMHPPTIRAFLAASRRRRPLWMQGWGQTETGPLTFRFLTRRSVAAAGLRHPCTRNLGRPIPGRVRLLVVDPVTLRPVGRGRPGLVFADTRARCLGYLGEPQRWADKRAGRWWNTGDVGVLTRSGAVRFLDREVDALPGLSCVEVEDVVEDRLPQVLECVLLGAVDRPPLPVVVTADGRLDPAAWSRAVRDLPPMAEPIALTWDELPRTATGKVRRHELLHRMFGPAHTHGSGRWT